MYLHGSCCRSLTTTASIAVVRAVNNNMSCNVWTCPGTVELASVAATSCQAATHMSYDIKVPECSAGALAMLELGTTASAACMQT